MKISIIILLVTLSLPLFSQNPNISIFKVKEFGYVSIPDNLEVQSGIYKQLKDLQKILFGFDSIYLVENRVVFQNKGLNQGYGKETYARVIIKTYLGKPGDYSMLNSINKLSNNELNNIKTTFYSQDFEKISMKIIDWFGVQNVQLNGKYNGIKISYSRTILDNPPVYVDLFQINNNDRMHEITFSYRQKDSLMWNPIFKKIRESILIEQR